MKVSSIKNAFHTMVEGVQTRKAQKLDRLMRSNVTYNREKLSGDVLEKLDSAQRTLGNYAQANRVRIYVTGVDNSVSPHQPKGQLWLEVMDKKSGKANVGILDADTKKLHEYKEIGSRMYETSDETQVIKKYIKASHEDNFLSNLYRYVETLTGDLRH